MMTEIGRVVEAGGGRARVEVSQSGICAHCDMASSCVPTSSGTRIIEVSDPLGVSADQQVRIELSRGGFVGASFLAYVVPLVGLFLGALIGSLAAGPASREMWGGLGAVAGLAAGFYVSRAAADSFSRRGRLTPAISAIVKENDQKEIEDANEDVLGQRNDL